MPDPQKSDLRPDAPEQNRPDTFCRDCVSWESFKPEWDVCLYFERLIMPGQCNKWCFQRRPA